MSLCAKTNFRRVRPSTHHGAFSVPSLNCHNPCGLSALMVLIFTPVRHNSITSNSVSNDPLGELISHPPSKANRSLGKA